MEGKMRHILVAIEDLRRAPVTELRKVALLAKAAGAHIELFHAIPDVAFVAPAAGVPPRKVHDPKTAIAAERCRRLRQIARTKALQGLDVQCTVVWDEPSYEAIIRRVLATGTDLVVCATRRHRFGARLWSQGTDWELIRHCPAPLLLVKSRCNYASAPILAAVDPFHAHAKPANLDAQLLRVGRKWARLTSGELHIFHAYMPLVPIVSMPVATAAPLIVLPPEAEKTHRRQVTRAIDGLAARAGISAPHRHVVLGDVPGALSTIAKRVRPAVVVMGAVSRSAVARLLIGSTAERVLDGLPCDVLVVKPPGFKSMIGTRTVSEQPAMQPKGLPEPLVML
jgi:universal stress protein E